MASTVQEALPAAVPVEEEIRTGTRYGFKLHPFPTVYEGSEFSTPSRIKRAEFAYVALARLGVDIERIGEPTDVEAVSKELVRAKFDTPNGCTLRVDEYICDGLGITLDAVAKVYRPIRVKDSSSSISLKLRDWSIEPSGMPASVDGVSSSWSVWLPRDYDTHKFKPDASNAEDGTHDGVGPAKLLLHRAGLLPPF